MSKFSSEFKLKIVKEYLSGKETTTSLVKKYSVDLGSVIKWIGLYRNHGAKGLCRKKSSYDGKFKVKVIEYMQEHNLSFRETAAKFGIYAFESVSNWYRIYCQGGPQALFIDKRKRVENSEPNPKKRKQGKRTEKDLIAEIERLRLEIDYLKKLNTLIQAKERSVTKRK